MTFLQTVFITILTTGSAFLASYLTNRSNLQRLKAQFDLEAERETIRHKKEMLEQIYNSIYIWNGSTVRRYLTFVALLKEQITWDKYISSLSEVDEDRGIQLGIIEIKINTHFPSMIEKWEILTKYFRNMAQFHVDYTKAREIGESNNLQLLQLSQDSITIFMNSVKEFKAELVSLSKTA